MGEMSLHLPCHDASPDMEYDLTGPFIRSCYLTGLRPNFQINVWGSEYIRMFRCVSTRGNVMVFRFSNLLSPKVICEIVDLTKKQHFCLTFPGKVKMGPT